MKSPMSIILYFEKIQDRRSLRHRLANWLSWLMRDLYRLHQSIIFSSFYTQPLFDVPHQADLVFQHMWQYRSQKPWPIKVGWMGLLVRWKVDFWTILAWRTTLLYPLRGSLLWTCVFVTSAEEGGYVFTSVCLSVCLSVRRITEKVVNGFWRNSLEG